MIQSLHPVSIVPAVQASRLTGRLALSFEQQAESHKTTLTIREQTPPLRVIRAFENSDGSALAHLHNVSGGVLGGDCLDLSIDVAAGAAAQVTTTSATRLYRTALGRVPATQMNRISVGPHGLLEMLPDALIPFAGASYIQQTRIMLAEGAGLFWWETLAPGRKASNELFQYDLLDLTMRIESESRPLALERLRLQPGRSPLQSPARLGRYHYTSTFYICRVGAATETWAALERELGDLAARLSGPDGALWAVSTLVADGLVIRGLTQSQPQAAEGLLTFWRCAKLALYGRVAIPPRKVY